MLKPKFQTQVILTSASLSSTFRPSQSFPGLAFIHLYTQKRQASSLCSYEEKFVNRKLVNLSAIANIKMLIINLRKRDGLGCLLASNTGLLSESSLLKLLPSREASWWNQMSLNVEKVQGRAVQQENNRGKVTWWARALEVSANVCAMCSSSVLVPSTERWSPKDIRALTPIVSTLPRVAKGTLQLILN